MIRHWREVSVVRIHYTALLLVFGGEELSHSPRVRSLSSFSAFILQLHDATQV